MPRVTSMKRGLILLSAKAAEAKFQESDEPGVFRKELIYPGDFVKKTEDGEIEFELPVDDHLIDHWVATFKTMRQNGVEVPLVIEHTTNPEARRGSVIKLAKEWSPSRNTNALYMYCKFRDKEAEKLALTAQVSLFSPPDFIDGRGNEYDRPIRHVAITDYPLIPGLGKFESIAASLVLSNSTPKLNGAKMSRLSRLAYRLGIDVPDNASDEDIEQQITAAWDETDVPEDSDVELADEDFEDEDLDMDDGMDEDFEDEEIPASFGRRRGRSRFRASDDLEDEDLDMDDGMDEDFEDEEIPASFGRRRGRSRFRASDDLEDEDIYDAQDDGGLPEDEDFDMEDGMDDLEDEEIPASFGRRGRGRVRLSAGEINGWLQSKGFSRRSDDSGEPYMNKGKVDIWVRGDTWSYDGPGGSQEGNGLAQLQQTLKNAGVVTASNRSRRGRAPRYQFSAPTVSANSIPHSIVRQISDSRATRLQQLVDQRKITPAVADQLAKKYCATKRVAVALSQESRGKRHGDDFDAVVHALSQNATAFEVGSRTPAQHYQDSSGGRGGVSPLVRDAERRSSQR